MIIGHARTIYLLLFVKVVSGEIVFEWFHLSQRIRGEVYKFRAISFEYINNKFYLTLVDRDKRTPGVGYVAWFLPGEDTSPKLNIHGDKNDYRLYHEKGFIMAPMLIRADPCGSVWVMDANMYDISGEQIRTAPVFHIYEHHIRKHIFRDVEWNETSVFMNIAFEIYSQNKKHCDPLAVYLANSYNFNVVGYHYRENSKHSHLTRVPKPYIELPNGYPRILKSRQLGGIQGLTLVKTDKFGPLLLFHVLGGTTEYIIQLESTKNESTLHEEDIRIVIEKGLDSEAGRTAYDHVTGTLFFAEVKTRKIGFLNLRNALLGDTIGLVYRRFDIKLTKGMITDMKVIGQYLWLLISSESWISLEKESIHEMIHEKRKVFSSSKNAICELLECTKSLPKNNQDELSLNSYLLLISIFWLILEHNTISG